MTDANYMEVGEGHCLICHGNIALGDHHHYCAGTVTPCSLQCGRWFNTCNNLQNQAKQTAMTPDDFTPPPDPASCLPFACELEPHDPNVERLPNVFQGSDVVLDKTPGRYSM